ncbi:MAG: NUDIX domain-containing protein [Candidatus Paceibacterota bacterium]
MSKYPLSEKDFFDIYSKVPRLCVDLIIKSKEGILLTKRAIDPRKGFWHLPGGTVFKKEKISNAILRIAKDETGLIVMPKKFLGYIEFLNEIRSNVQFHSVSVAIEVKPTSNNFQPDENSSELKYFKKLPNKMIKEQKKFLENCFCY